MTRRLFIAIDMPDAVKRRLARLVAEPPDGVRATRQAQTHLTLHFLGDVEEAPQARLTDALKAVQSRPFSIDLDGVGRFPPRGRASVVWVGVGENPSLMALHAGIGDVLRQEGFTVEQRPYTPHVTLARLTARAPQSWVERFLEDGRDVSIPDIPVEAFTLYSSERSDNVSERSDKVSPRGGNYSPRGDGRSTHAVVARYALVTVET